jgi:hypothetical protein
MVDGLICLNRSSRCPIQVHGTNDCNCILSQGQQHPDEQTQLHWPNPPANVAILSRRDNVTDHAIEGAKQELISLGNMKELRDLLNSMDLNREQSARRKRSRNERAKTINERERSHVKENEEDEMALQVLVTMYLWHICN